MIRKRYGINLDQGIPLGKEDFDLLHVNCFGDISEQLTYWLKEEERPLFVGGQIGSGKSTLIVKSILEADKKPDIILHFDQDSLNLDIGDFWAITLLGFLEASIKNGVDLSFCKLLPKDLGGFEVDDWDALLNALHPTELSIEAFQQKRMIRRKIAEYSGFIASVLEEMGKHLSERLGGSIFIYAGLDKFEPARAGAFAIQEVIEFLKGFKTLFEVNAVHLFSSFNSSSVKRLLLPYFEEASMIELLSKRLGVYHQPLAEELQLIAGWSGGNPRQALRILTYFETASRKKKSKMDSIVHALRECTTDFFSYSAKPSNELMKTVMRDGKIESTLLSLPGDRDTARQALYANWILIGSRDGGTAWHALVNPLIKSSFEQPLGMEDPERKLLDEYAQSKGISSLGLEFSRIVEETGKEKQIGQIVEEVLAQGVEEPFHTNLTEVFDVLQSALLSIDRKDRVIIAYQEQDVAEAARSYLFAKANTYEYQKCAHFQIEGGSEQLVIQKLEEILSQDVDIFSIELAGVWEKEQLEVLDLQRDRLIQFEMIWWIPYENLKTYLPYWVQLRQLFEIFVLEDELLSSLSVDEIQQDIQFFEELVDEEDSAEGNVVKHLKTVLDYLEKAREGGAIER